jgi:hypothetical protein
MRADKSEHWTVELFVSSTLATKIRNLRRCSNA